MNNSKNSPHIKVKKQLSDLTSAVSRLKEALALPSTPIHKDASIQRFEFSFELSWKIMQTIASIEGLEEYGPRNSIRTAAQLHLIENPDAWFEILAARNLTTHIYNQAVADKVYEEAKKLTPLIDNLIDAIKTYPGLKEPELPLT